MNRGAVSTAAAPSESELVAEFRLAGERLFDRLATMPNDQRGVRWYRLANLAARLASVDGDAGRPQDPSQSGGQ